MSDFFKVVVISLLLALAGCSSDSGSGTSAPAAGGDAAGESMASAEPAGSEVPFPKGPIETPEWASLEQEVITYE